ncbi:MAG: SPFH domain-containing protein [Anaerolineales bacterium]
MARIFDVIEYPNEMSNEIVHRFPEEGIGDYRIGSQVIVRESQSAVFFRDGNALDVFGPGRHTIATANIPMLIDFIGKAFNDRTPSLLKCTSSPKKNLQTKNGVLLKQFRFKLQALALVGCCFKGSELSPSK